MAQKDFGPTSDLGPTGRSIHTKFYIPAANKNDCDMGIAHDYRYVNTENLFRALSDSERQYSRYDFADLLSQAYREYTEFDNRWLTKYVTARPVESSDSFYNITELNFSGFPDFETRDTDLTLAAGEKYTVNKRTYYFNSFNIVATAAAHTLEYPAYQYPNQVIDLTAQHAYRNINTRKLYRDNTSLTIIEQTDVGAWLYSQSASSSIHYYLSAGVITTQVDSSHTGEFYHKTQCQISNLPVKRSPTTGIITGTVTYKNGYYPDDWSVSASSPSGTYSGYLYPNQNKSVSGYAYCNMSNLYRNNLGTQEKQLDIGWISKTYTDRYWCENTGTITPSNSFYRYVNINIYNIPQVSDSARFLSNISKYAYTPLYVQSIIANSVSNNGVCCNVLTSFLGNNTGGGRLITYPGQMGPYTRHQGSSGELVEDSSLIGSPFKGYRPKGSLESGYYNSDPYYFISYNGGGHSALVINNSGWYSIDIVLSALVQSSTSYSYSTPTGAFFELQIYPYVGKYTNGTSSSAVPNVSNVAAFINVYSNNSSVETYNTVIVQPSSWINDTSINRINTTKGCLKAILYLQKYAVMRGIVHPQPSSGTEYIASTFTLSKVINSSYIFNNYLI